MKKFEFLHSISLFKGLSDDQLKILANAAIDRIYHAGELIIGEEDESHTFFMVMQGKVKMFKGSIDGKEQTLYLFAPGDFFGLCSAFTNGAFPANAMALENSSLLLFSGEALKNLANHDPSFFVNMLIAVSEKLKTAMNMIESLSLKEIPQRVASFLLISTSQKDAQEKDSFEFPVSQRELAKIFGATPETLSRVLKKLSTEGIIKTQGRTLQILNRKALEAIALGQ